MISRIPHLLAPFLLSFSFPLTRGTNVLDGRRNDSATSHSAALRAPNALLFFPSLYSPPCDKPFPTWRSPLPSRATPLRYISRLPHITSSAPSLCSRARCSLPLVAPSSSLVLHASCHVLFSAYCCWFRGSALSVWYFWLWCSFLLFADRFGVFRDLEEL